MDNSLVFLTLIGMGVVTYLPRLLPMLLLSGRTLAPWIARWLSFVPATVLAALLAPGLFCRDGNLDLSVENLYLMAAVPTFLVAWKFKSFFGTVATGMGFIALARYMI